MSDQILQCADCKRWFCSRDGVQTADGYSYCDQHQDENTWQCDKCGQLFSKYTWPCYVNFPQILGEAKFCQQCFEEVFDGVSITLALNEKGIEKWKVGECDLMDWILGRIK